MEVVWRLGGWSGGAFKFEELSQPWEYWRFIRSHTGATRKPKRISPWYIERIRVVPQTWIRSTGALSRSRTSLEPCTTRSRYVSTCDYREKWTSHFWLTTHSQRWSSPFLRPCKWSMLEHSCLHSWHGIGHICLSQACLSCPSSLDHSH